MNSTSKVTLPPVSSFDPGHVGYRPASTGLSGHSPANDRPSSSEGPTMRTPVYLPPLNNARPTSAASGSSNSMQPPPPAPRQKRSLEQFQFPRPQSGSPQQRMSASESSVAVKREPSDSPPHRSLEPQPTNASASSNNHTVPASAGPNAASYEDAADSPAQEVPDSAQHQQNQPAGSRKRRKVANLNTAKANGNLSPASAAKPPQSARRAGGKGGRVSPLPLGQTTHKRTASGNLLYQPPDQPSPVSPIVMGFDAASALQDPSRAPTLRKSLSLKEQQKALIESRKLGGVAPSFPATPGHATASAAASTSAGPSRESGVTTRGQVNANGQGQDTAEDTDMTDAVSPHTTSMAGRREKAKKLTIQTSHPGTSNAVAAEDAEGRPEGQRGLSQSIKSAPIRPSGYQHAAQNARLPPPSAAYQRRASGQYENGPLPPSHHPGYPQRLPGHIAPLTAGPRMGFPPEARMHPSQMGARRLSPILSASDGPPTSLPPMRDVPPPPQSASFGNSQWPPGRPRDRADLAASKANFLGLFEVFYDSLADSNILQSNLEEQIRRSAVLLSSLSQSSSVFESMIDRRLNEMCTSLTGDLQVLEGRIERLEQAFEGSQGSNLPPLTPHLHSSLAQQQHRNPQSHLQPPPQSAPDRRHSLADLSAVASSSSSTAAPSTSLAQTNFRDTTANAKSRLEMLEQSATSLLDSRLSSHATSNLRGNEEQQRRPASSSSAQPTSGGSNNNQ